MKKGIYGKKLGMTQIFDENGLAIPVTVVEVEPCVVIKKKTVETEIERRNIIEPLGKEKI